SAVVSSASFARTRWPVRRIAATSSSPKPTNVMASRRKRSMSVPGRYVLTGLYRTLHRSRREAQGSREAREGLMGETTGIAWCHHTFNPWWGCVEVSPACDFCLAPETRILRANGTWVPIAEAKVGDELYGFDDTRQVGRNRMNAVSRIEAKWTT